MCILFVWLGMEYMEDLERVWKAIVISYRSLALYEFNLTFTQNLYMIHAFWSNILLNWCDIRIASSMHGSTGTI